MIEFMIDDLKMKIGSEIFSYSRNPSGDATIIEIIEIMQKYNLPIDKRVIKKCLDNDDIDALKYCYEKLHMKPTKSDLIHVFRPKNTIFRRSWYRCEKIPSKKSHKTLDLFKYLYNKLENPNVPNIVKSLLSFQVSHCNNNISRAIKYISKDIKLNDTQLIEHAIKQCNYEVLTYLHEDKGLGLNISPDWLYNISSNLCVLKSYYQNNSFFVVNAIKMLSYIKKKWPKQFKVFSQKFKQIDNNINGENIQAFEDDVNMRNNIFYATQIRSSISSLMEMYALFDCDFYGKKIKSKLENAFDEWTSQWPMNMHVEVLKKIKLTKSCLTKMTNKSYPLYWIRLLDSQKINVTKYMHINTFNEMLRSMIFEQTNTLLDRLVCGLGYMPTPNTYNNIYMYIRPSHTRYNKGSKDRLNEIKLRLLNVVITLYQKQKTIEKDTYEYMNELFKELKEYSNFKNLKFKKIDETELELLEGELRCEKQWKYDNQDQVLYNFDDDLDFEELEFDEDVDIESVDDLDLNIHVR